MTDTSSLSQLQTTSIALQNFAIGTLLVLFSTISFQISGFSFGLAFIPIVVLMYWPKRASRSWSLVFVFALGLMQGMLNFSPLGLWAFCYLLLFIIFGGEIKFSERLSAAWGSYLVCVFIIGLVLFFVGRFVLGQWPNPIPLFTDALASILVFPLLFSIRKFAKAMRSEPERREII